MNIIGRQIILFAKAPVPGHCKTRLGRHMGYTRAARIYVQLLERVIDTVCQVDCNRVTLFCAPDTRHPTLRRLARENRLVLSRQKRGDLGQRMHHALTDALKASEQTVLLGSDCPELTPAMIEKAFDALAAGRDLVFCPATDGGYVLVGANSAADARIFRGLDWGTSTVMAGTRLRMSRLGLDWTELPALPDLDEPADYRAARRSGVLPPAI